MKKLNFLIILLVLLTLTGLSQVPDAFNYQAVVRNSSGEVISNQIVSFRISILKNSTSGTVVYSETQNKQTNSFGLVTLKIGKGSRVSGSFDPANWGTSSHFIKIEFDANGGSSYTLLGTSELLSVPYAFHAQTVEIDKVDDADADATNEIQELQLSGTQLTLSKNGGTVTLPSSGGGGDNWGTQNVVSDATLSGEGTTANPLSVVGDLTDNQTLSIKNNQLSIKDGNTVTLPAGSTSPWSTNGNSTYYNNGGVGIGTSTPFYMLDIHGQNSSPYLRFRTNSSGGQQNDGFLVGMKEANSSTWLYNYEETPMYFGTNGSTRMIITADGKIGIGDISPTNFIDINSHSEAAFLSLHNTATGASNTDGFLIGTTNTNSQSYIWNHENTPLKIATNNAVRMTVAANGNIGIGTENPSSMLAVGGNGASIANIYGESGTANKIAIYGINTSSSGPSSTGGSFVSTSSSGRGLMGTANASTGPTYGGFFESSSTSGTGAYGISKLYGIFGNANGSSGETSGGRFEASSTEARAVYGLASSTTGTNYGGAFKSVSSNGTGVWASGGKYDFYAGGPGTDYGTSSSKRWKENIVVIGQPLDKIAAIRGVYFDWDKEHGGQHDVGFIAEEVGKVLPEIVDYEENGIDAIGLDYSKLSPLLVEAVKELKTENEQLSAKVKNLESRLAELESFVKASASK